MSLSWYFHRLRAMSPAELLHRVGEKAKKDYARNRLEGWERYPALAIKPLPGLRDRLLSAPDGVRSDIAQSANRVLAGEFSALGVNWPKRTDELFPSSLWTLDPVTGGQWSGSSEYCFDISYRHERQLGDIKYVWEINRLQFLQPLAAHALLTGDATSVAAIEAAVASWYQANPPFRGLGWNSGIELALRAISLLVVASLLADRLSPAALQQIGSILHAHAVWMKRYPSRFSSANNHLVAELAGEFLLGLALPDLPSAAAITAHARHGLIAETAKQILADGVPAEQSPSYGAFTAEFILLAANVARDSGASFPDSVGQRLGKFADFISWLALDDSTVPAIGDDDDGRVLTLGVAEHTYPASVVNAVAGYLGQGAATNLPADFRGALLGAPATLAAPKSGVQVFPDGGYSAVRDEIAGRRVELVFDHGPLGYLSIAAHGHADALSLTLALDGKPVLVDPGTYLYHSGGAWRDWFRGTAAHNTLTLGQANQSTISGSFNWSQKATASLERHTGGANWSVVASHDGYKGRFGVIHQRTLARTECGLAITDQLLGAATQQDADVSFQLAADVTARIEGRDVVILRDSVALMTLVFVSGELRLESGGEDATGGWVSPHFGKKVPADRIVWTGIVGAEGTKIGVHIHAPVGQVGSDQANEKALS